MLLGARDGDAHVLAGVETQSGVIGHPQPHQRNVMRQAGNRFDFGLRGDHGKPRADHVLVVVDQFDFEIAVGMPATQQDITFIALVVGQRERRVPVHLDVALQHEGLARRALPFLAPVHQHDALPERRVENRLVLVGLDVDAHRFETNLMGLAHERTPNR